MRPRFLAISILVVSGTSMAFGTGRSWLSGLDPADPASLCTARQRFLSEFRPASPEQSKALFELWQFYEQSAQTNSATYPIAESLTEDQRAQLWSKDPSKRLAVVSQFPVVRGPLAPWLRCGYSVRPDVDDTILLDRDPVFLKDIKDVLRPEVRAYIDLFSSESPNWLDYDLALAIPLDRLRSRIGRWEEFRNQSSNIPALAAHLDEQIKLMFDMYLGGMPNSPLFDDQGRIHDWARASYEQFVRLNTKSHYYRVLVSACATLKRHDWQASAELVSLYDQKGFPTDLIKNLLTARKPGS